MSRKFHGWILGLVALALCLPLAHGSDDLDDDELIEEVTAEAIEWQPYITHLYVKSREATPAPSPLHFEKQGVILPSLKAGWQDLKPRVRFRGAEYWGLSFLDEESVVSGWRLNKMGSGFEIHAGMVLPPPASKEKKPAAEPLPREKRSIQGCLDSQELTIFVGVDVLINVVDPQKRDELLGKYFRLDRFVLSIHRIDEEIGKFRAPVDKTPITNGRTGQRLDRTEDWMKARDMVSNFTWTKRLRLHGAYAIRVKAAVSGRVDDFELFSAPKEVEGEIRFVLVDQTFQVDQLEFVETGKTDLFKKKGDK